MKNAIQHGAEWLTRIEIWPVAISIAISMAWPRYLPIAIGIGIIYWGIRYIAYNHLSIRTANDWSVVFLIITILVTLFITAMPDVTKPQSLRVVTGIILFYAIVNWTRSEKNLQLLIKGIVMIGITLALVAPFSVQWATDKISFIPDFLYQKFTPIISDWVHPNVLAGSLILIFPIAFSLLIYNWRMLNWSMRLLYLSASIIMLVVIVLTQSRGAWIAVAATLFFTLCLLWRRVWIGILLLLLLSFLAIYHFGTTTVIESLASNPSIGDVNNRLDIWLRAIYMIQDYPFTGIGMGLFKETTEIIYPLSQTPSAGIPHAHNLFLQIGVDLGIPGLVAWLSILVLIIAVSWQLYRKGRSVSSWAAGLGAGLLLSQFALILHGLTDSVTWGMVRSAPIVWGIWGIAAASSNFFSRQINKNPSE